MKCRGANRVYNERVAQLEATGLPHERNRRHKTQAGPRGLVSSDRLSDMSALNGLSDEVVQQITPGATIAVCSPLSRRDAVWTMKTGTPTSVENACI